MRLILFIICLLINACQPPAGGNSIGRRPLPERAQPINGPIHIRQVFATGDASAFVQLSNDGDKPFDFVASPLTLLSDFGQIELARLNPPLLPLAPQERRAIAAQDLQMQPSVGELLLVDAAFIPQSYLAWGNAPDVFDSGLAALAESAGVAASDVYVKLSYPAPANTAFAIDHADANAPLVLGCVTPDPNRQTPVTPAECVSTGPAVSVQITEVMPLWGDGSGSWMELVSNSPMSIDLYGVRLCRRGDCQMIERSIPIAAGQIIQLFLGILPPNIDAQHAALPAHATLTGSEEIALVAPGAIAQLDLLSYVRIGATAPSELSSQAFAAGLWEDPSSQQTISPPRVLGDSVSLNSNAAAVAAAWHTARATPLVMNAQISPDDPGSWTGCSDPLREAPAQIAITNIAMSSPNRVALTNLGSVARDLSGMQLALGAATYALPGATLAPQGRINIELRPDGSPCTSAQFLCWQNAAATFTAGEASVLDSTGGIIHHLQWGDAGLASIRGIAARDANVWPGPQCRVAAAADSPDAITLWLGLSGHSPADYH